MAQILITAEQRAKMLENGRAQQKAQAQDTSIDHPPVVKLFTPDGAATWVLSELDPDDETRAFGLCDLGVGCPELGWVDLDELKALRGPLGLPVERDTFFSATKGLSHYTDLANKAGRIVA